MRSRTVLKFLTLAALAAGTVMLLLPATASADALVSPNGPCVAYANAGTTYYEGAGTQVITANGDVVLSCHLSLVYGTAAAEPTRTTTGNCELLQLPSGRAVLSCHYSLL
jgi:hypothetical protein